MIGSRLQKTATNNGSKDSERRPNILLYTAKRYVLSGDKEDRRRPQSTYLVVTSYVLSGDKLRT